MAVGDDVALNQTLCTVETNKAEVEIPSPFAGRIVELGGADGETLAVGAVLVRIATDAPAPVAQDDGKPRRKPVLVGYGTDDDMDTSRRTQLPDGTRPRAKPPVRKLAADLHVDLASLTPGSGPDGIVTRDDVLSVAGKSGPGLRRRRRSRCAGDDGAADDAVAEQDPRCARQCPGRLLDAAEGA